MGSSQCELYLYTPSLPLAVIGVLLFSSLLSIHSMRMIQAKTWAGLFFVLGAFGNSPIDYSLSTSPLADNEKHN
jgi:hypothetical protein